MKKKSARNWALIVTHEFRTCSLPLSLKVSLKHRWTTWAWQPNANNFPCFSKPLEVTMFFALSLTTAQILHLNWAVAYIIASSVHFTIWAVPWGIPLVSQTCSGICAHRQEEMKCYKSMHACPTQAPKMGVFDAPIHPSIDKVW